MKLFLKPTRMDNFTANYPWVCEKDGVYYEYDKEAECFKKRAD